MWLGYYLHIQQFMYISDRTSCFDNVQDRYVYCHFVELHLQSSTVNWHRGKLPFYQDSTHGSDSHLFYSIYSITFFRGTFSTRGNVILKTLCIFRCCVVNNLYLSPTVLENVIYINAFWRIQTKSLQEITFSKYYCYFMYKLLKDILILI